jgi:hypothetical protein
MITGTTKRHGSQGDGAAVRRGRVDGAVGTWQRLVELAAGRLAGDGWRVEAVRHEALADWHVVARRSGKWRVIQVLAPGTPAPARNDRRIGLGQTVRLAAKQGTMEQWMAHVRPGGRIVFGAEVLYGAMWAGVAPEAELPWRLGLPPEAPETVDTAADARRAAVII